MPFGVFTGVVTVGGGGGVLERDAAGIVLIVLRWMPWRLGGSSPLPP
ncbi:hypothetical protein Pla86_03170 [Planctomycetes bacterium Pla86]|nr:hypothetical protein Pla86_03170 [Planctomycetes bacterium Pla86]